MSWKIWKVFQRKPPKQYDVGKQVVTVSFDSCDNLDIEMVGYLCSSITQKWRPVDVAIVVSRFLRSDDPIRAKVGTKGSELWLPRRRVVCYSVGPRTPFTVVEER